MTTDQVEPELKKGHPKGLYLLFFTEMWERFSYYGMRGILIYYLTKSIIEGGLGISESSGSLIYGTFTGFVYFTPLIGGWLADKYLGQRKSITIGGVLMMLGQFVLFMINSQIGLFLGLFLLIIGNGFFKPNISTLVGGLYKEGDPKRDAAFSIFYMGINIGAFFAPLVVGLLSDNIFAIKDGSGEILTHGYRYGFLAASIGMLIGQILYSMLGNKYLGDLGVVPSAKSSNSVITEGIKNEVNEKLTPAERKRVTAIFIYFFFAIFFFAGFEQAGSSISLYTDKFIDRDITLPLIGDFLIPASWFQSVNPIFIVLLTPIFALLWPSKVGQKITTPMKMGSGLIFLGIGFFFMLGAIHQRGGDSVEDITIKASLWWVVFTYLLHTIGELCLSPVGLSTVTKLAPHKLASLLMGVWLLSSCFANWLGGGIAAIIGSYGAGTIFTILALFPMVCGIVLICLNKVLLKMMNGVR